MIPNVGLGWAMNARRRATALDSARDRGWLSRSLGRSARRPHNLSYRVMPLPLPPGTARVLPMQLQVGDHDGFQWRVGSGGTDGPTPQPGGRTPTYGFSGRISTAVTEVKLWGSYEKVSVRRGPVEEGKR